MLEPPKHCALGSTFEGGKRSHLGPSHLRKRRGVARANSEFPDFLSQHWFRDRLLVVHHRRNPRPDVYSLLGRAARRCTGAFKERDPGVEG